MNRKNKHIQFNVKEIFFPFDGPLSSAAGDAKDPEHLHDPPFLKHIPHLWPGGGDIAHEDGDDGNDNEDHNGNNNYDDDDEDD